MNIFCLSCWETLLLPSLLLLLVMDSYMLPAFLRLFALFFCHSSGNLFRFLVHFSASEELRCIFTVKFWCMSSSSDSLEDRVATTWTVICLNWMFTRTSFWSLTREECHFLPFVQFLENYCTLHIHPLLVNSWMVIYLLIHLQYLLNCHH